MPDSSGSLAFLFFYFKENSRDLTKFFLFSNTPHAALFDSVFIINFAERYFLESTFENKKYSLFLEIIHL